MRNTIKLNCDMCAYGYVEIQWEKHNTAHDLFQKLSLALGRPREKITAQLPYITLEGTDTIDQHEVAIRARHATEGWFGALLHTYKNRIPFGRIFITS